MNSYPIWKSPGLLCILASYVRTRSVFHYPTSLQTRRNRHRETIVTLRRLEQRAAPQLKTASGEVLVSPWRSSPVYSALLVIVAVPAFLRAFPDTSEGKTFTCRGLSL